MPRPFADPRPSSVLMVEWPVGWGFSPLPGRRAVWPLISHDCSAEPRKMKVTSSSLRSSSVSLLLT